MIQRAGIEEIYDPAIGYVVRAKRAQQKNNGLGGAGNTVIRGLTNTRHLKEL